MYRFRKDYSGIQNVPILFAILNYALCLLRVSAPPRDTSWAPNPTSPSFKSLVEVFN
jgi:hypothetical protein